MTSGTGTPPMILRRILVVDDSLSVRQTVQEAFAGVQHVQVHTCGDVEAAEDLLTVHPPDLVLCDVVLPGRPGYELCHRLTRDRQDGHPLVFLLSGAFEPFDEGKAAAAGADAVINKPFRPDEIRERLEGLLDPRATVEGEPAEISSSPLGDITAADLLPEPPVADTPAAAPPESGISTREESSTEELVRRMLPALAERLVEPVTALLLEKLQEPLAAQAGELLRREAESQVRRRLQELEHDAVKHEQQPPSPRQDD